MKILVNAQPMTGLLTGIARYLRNMYAVMAEMDQTELTFFTGKAPVTEIPPLADTEKWQKTTRTVWKLPDPVVFSLRSLYWLSYERRLKKICRGNRFDLYHETAFFPAAQTRVPTVYSIYDLSLRRFKETHPRERVWYFEFFIKRRLQYAAHILTISEFIRREIIEEFGFPPEKVSTVPLAPDPIFGPRAAEEVTAVQKTLGLPQDYLLFVSSLEPRKNIGILIKALQAVKTDIPVVMVGWQAWGEKKWLEKIRISGLRNRIYMTGHISDSELVAVYNGASALVYPSIYEGFGLPILEAMACNCPVICSRVASMPEAAGEAALLIDPHDRDELAAAIEALVFKKNTRENCIRLGRERVKNFSWGKTARKTYAVFQKVVKQNDLCCRPE